MKKSESVPTAEQFMNQRVFTVESGAKLVEIVEQLLKHKVSNVPVVDDVDGQPCLVGFISEADCLEHLSNELFYGNPSPHLTAEHIMKRHPVCVAPDTNIFALASIFMSHRVRHLPVVDQQRLLGIVSRRDILKELDRVYRETITTSEAERHRPDLKQIINHRFIVRG